MQATEATAHCLKCGRGLTSARSIARGYGGGCWAKVRRAAKAADLHDFKPRQLDQAEELIEDGAIVPLRANVFRTVSTDGTETYLTHPQTCSCPAGLKGRACYHTAAARILIAA